MELPWGGLEREATGRWDRLAAEVRAWPGTAIISHEILGRASRLQAARALASLGRPRPRGARGVLRARPRPADPRGVAGEHQAPAHARPTAPSWRTCRTPSAPPRWPSGSGACRRSPTSSTAGRRRVPRERVHLVTVPPPGSSPTLLWERFAGLFGLDPAEFTPTERVERLARRPRVDDDPPAQHPPEQRARRLRLPPRSCARSWCTSTSPGARTPRGSRCRPTVHEWATSLSRVLGQRAGPARVRRRRRPRRPDPRRRPGPFVDPDTVDEHDVAEVALDALAVMTIEAARLRQVEKDLHGVIEDLMGQLDAAHGTRIYRAQGEAGRRWRSATCWRARRTPAYRRLRRQELAVDVAPDPPGRDPVGAGADETADHGDAASHDGGQPLPGHLREQLGGHLAGHHVVEVPVVDGRGRDRHRGAGQLLPADQRDAPSRRPAGWPGWRCGYGGPRGRSRAGARSPRPAGTGSAPGR